MSTTDLRLELKSLIDNETDPQILKAVRTLLQKSALDPLLKEKLTSRAKQSEENIKKGNTFQREDFEKKLQGKVNF